MDGGKVMEQLYGAVKLLESTRLFELGMGYEEYRGGDREESDRCIMRGRKLASAIKTVNEIIAELEHDH